jgi:sulfur transfer protein SufE
MQQVSKGPAGVTIENADGAIVDGVDTLIRATVIDLTDTNPIAVALVDGDGAHITSIGGGVEYTEGDTDASLTGKVALAEGPSETATPLQVDASKHLQVDIAADSAGLATSANQSTIAGHVDGIEGLLVTIDGDTGSMVTSNAAIQAAVEGTLTVGLPSGAATAANQTTVIGHLDGVEGLLTTIDGDTATLAGAVSGSEIQVDVVAALPAGTNLLGRAQIEPQAGNALSIFRSLDLDESEEEVKGSAGSVYTLWFTNTATSTRWLKFYNDTAANVVVGTTAPVLTIGLPGNTSDDISGVFSTAMGLGFDTAITVAATTGVADNDTGAPGANEVIVNIGYK